MKTINTFNFRLALLGIAIAVLLLATSCSHNGYGCHGNSRIMTRVNAIDERDYQIELTQDSILIYDGERKVGSVKFTEYETPLDSLLLKDNL